MIKILTRCPVCENALKAVRLNCDACGTTIENSFEFPPLMRLNRDQMEFAEVFIRCRGNIKDVEKELGISYPTVRSKLDQLIEELSGGAVHKPEPISADVADGKREAVLKQLEEGAITAEEAIAALEKLK